MRFLLRLGVVVALTLSAATPTAFGSVTPADRVSVRAPSSCLGRTPTLVGTNGNDILNGGPGTDVIDGRGGNDTINGSGGKDYLCGGSGNDTINGGNGGDRLDGGSGADALTSDAGNDRLLGRAGNDTLLGGSGNDVANGGGGTDNCTAETTTGCENGTGTTTTTTTHAQPGNPGDSKNCSDFNTQAQAQAWFDTYYPYYGDVAHLDNDHDGIACETLP